MLLTLLELEPTLGLEGQCSTSVTGVTQEEAPSPARLTSDGQPGLSAPVSIIAFPTYCTYILEDWQMTQDFRLANVPKISLCRWAMYPVPRGLACHSKSTTGVAALRYPRQTVGHGMWAIIFFIRIKIFNAIFSSRQT